jgi:hypothetical protein
MKCLEKKLKCQDLDFISLKMTSDHFLEKLVKMQEKQWLMPYSKNVRKKTRQGQLHTSKDQSQLKSLRRRFVPNIDKIIFMKLNIWQLNLQE